jgi:hypothetical protein
MFDTSLRSLRALRRLGQAALIPAMVGACNPTAPNDSLPAGAVPMAAPEVYREWFARTQQCSHLSGTMDRVQFLVVPGVATFETEAGPKVGLWVRRGGQHYIVVAGDYADHEMVVRHEMLHSLIGASGHPAGLFSDKCNLTWETWGAD